MPDFGPSVDVNDFLTEFEPEYDWCIPGLMEKGDRLILTGNEGKGKSTLLRQIAVMSAMGLHPFGLNYDQEPLKVWYCDLENPRGHLRREIKKIKRTLPIDVGKLTIDSWPQGLDLSQPYDIQEVTNRLVAIQPQLVIIGPMYKMMPRLEEEASSAALARVIDKWRADYKCTFIIESHQPHEVIGKDGRFRPERPFGSSLWLRWPEFGLCLEDAGVLRHWRGARDEREWPTKMRWGDGWPWEPDTSDGLCLKCGKRLEGRQQRACSERCSAALRKQEQRARDRVVS